MNSGTDQPNAEASDSPSDVAGGAGSEDLQAALEAVKAEAAQYRDQYLRAVAELDNVRKRAQRDVEHAHRFALERGLYPRRVQPDR